uniref:NADH-ubiquinone oxidoreductase chain 6 n=1 Tax=Polyura schreiber TaxID=213156 RepID=A0A1U8Y4R5_9NEOP|nr:NADH dehydrogenase subunit 6 [Polyura schreiber]
MIKMLMSFLLIFISIIMFFTNHPIPMGLLILTQTLLVCMISGMIINSYWFSYILFLIFLGGLLVLFIYMSSIASNEMMKKFSLKNKFILLFMIMFLSIISFININNLNWLNFNFNEDMINFFNMFLFFNNENHINLFKLYNEQTYFLMLMMIIYLFFTLVTVVKITNIFHGPIRSFY